MKKTINGNFAVSGTLENSAITNLQTSITDLTTTVTNNNTTASSGISSEQSAREAADIGLLNALKVSRMVDVPSEYAAKAVGRLILGREWMASNQVRITDDWKSLQAAFLNK
jgi:hypothetical protein